jgi:hypothetical protein
MDAQMGLGADLNRIYLTGPRMRAFLALDMRRPADSEFADSVDLIEGLGRRGIWNIHRPLHCCLIKLLVAAQAQVEASRLVAFSAAPQYILAITI